MRFEFDNGSAHLTEAGADIFLMPSKYEPMWLEPDVQPPLRHNSGCATYWRPRRYGRRSYDPATGEGTGFVFIDYDAEQFKAAVDRALALWPDNKSWRRLMMNGMRQQLGWKNSAKKYLEAYERARKM